MSTPTLNVAVLRSTTLANADSNVQPAGNPERTTSKAVASNISFNNIYKKTVNKHTMTTIPKDLKSPKIHEASIITYSGTDNTCTNIYYLNILINQMMYARIYHRPHLTYQKS